MAAAPIPVPQTPVGDIAAQVARLRETFDTGLTRPAEWRIQQIGRVRDMMRENADALAYALKLDVGKPELEAYAADIMTVADEARQVAKSVRKWMKPRKVKGAIQTFPSKSQIVSDPLGVVLIISPWNYPVQLLVSPLLGALAAGNCVVLKPSEVTPHVSRLLAELVPKYLDRDAVCLVEGGVEETTELLEQRFDHIMYTGNGTVGRVVMAAAAKHLTPVTLELGGKSPCYVDGSAKLKVAAQRIAWGKWLNAGQTCIAPDYLLVERGAEGPLLEALKTAITEFYGDDPRKSPDYGRIVNTRHHRRVASLLKDGQVYLGGEVDEEDRYIAPTILTDVAPDSAAMTEEIFGPVLPVMVVDDVSDAIRFVNGRDKPLALYVFSERGATIDRFVSETSSGGLCANGTILHIGNPNLPFGGVGESGMGVYHGRSTFDTFSHQKAVMRRGTWLEHKFVYPPYTKRKTDMIKKMI
jgi:acyl-CoA reductase-like NAD-dependent aldehyde dehydrogenase